MRIVGRAVRALAAVWLFASCNGAEPEAARTGRVELAPEPTPGVTSALDSGNAAYRSRDYVGALRHYRAAAELGPDVAATWFGVYMAQLALGDTAAADSAMRRARALAPGLAESHPEPRDSAQR